MDVRTPTVYSWLESDELRKLDQYEPSCNAEIGFPKFRVIDPDNVGEDLARGIADRWNDERVLRFQNLWDAWGEHPLAGVHDRDELIRGIDVTRYTRELVHCGCELRQRGIFPTTAIIDEEGPGAWDYIASRPGEDASELDYSGRFALEGLLNRAKAQIHRKVREALEEGLGRRLRLIDYTAACYSPFAYPRVSDGLWARCVGTETSSVITYEDRYRLDQALVLIYACAQATHDAVVWGHEGNAEHLRTVRLTLNQHRAQIRVKFRITIALGLDWYWFNPGRADDLWFAQMALEELDRLRGDGHWFPEVDQREPSAIVRALMSGGLERYSEIENRVKAPKGAA